MQVATNANEFTFSHSSTSVHMVIYVCSVMKHSLHANERPTTATLEKERGGQANETLHVNGQRNWFDAQYNVMTEASFGTNSRPLDNLCKIWHD